MRRLVATLLAAVLVTVGLAVPAAAEGSKDLFPATSTPVTCASGGSCRPAIEWRTSFYGPTWAGGIPRRTLLSVFAQAGEQILVGSSSMPTTSARGSSDIVVWNPGVVADPAVQTLPAPSWRCTDQRATGGNSDRGFIADRSQETAGARSVDGSGNTAGYRPCYYTAPSTGIYRVAFYGTDGAVTDNQGTTPSGVVDPGTGTAFDLHRSAVNAWDVTVRAASTASTTNIGGRLFTYTYAGFAGGNAKPVYLTMYLTTHDGFEYEVDTNGFDPAGFVFYGNRTGFRNADGTPLNRNIMPPDGLGNQYGLTQLLGGTSIAPAEYPLSFEPLADETLVALGVPTVPGDPTVADVSFAGMVTATGSYVGQGGTFTFTTGSAGTYEIVVSRDGADFDPGLGANRALRAVVPAGTHTVTWDGRDNDGDAFPVGDDYDFRVTLRGGEYHAPMIDVESSVNGGPSITLLNPPNNLCPFTGEVSDGTNCTRAFYDDRAYVSSDGTQVGDPVSGQLCSTLVRDPGMPLTTFANHETGFDSTGTERAFGTTAAAPNANAACGSTASTLGDARGLDLWTYFPSTSVQRTLDVLPVPAVPVPDDDAYTTTTNTTLTVPAATGVLDGDAGSNLTVTSHTTPAAGGTLTLGADGALTYAPPTDMSGPVTFDYTVTDDAGQSASATVTIAVTPAGADDSGSVAVGGTLTVAAASGLLANDRGTSLTVTSVTQPAHGSVTSGADGAYAYTPPAGFSGADSFTYTARDGSGQTYTRTVSLTVTPTAADDTFTTGAQTPVSGDVLANDHGTLTVTGSSDPAHGVVVRGTGGSFTYTPDDDWSGVDTFTYTVSDGVSPAVTRTVTVTVTPTAADDAGTTSAGTSLTVGTGTGNLLANDLGALSVGTVTAPPAHGTVIVHANGAYTYVPDDGWSGVDTFVYSASDGHSPPVQATVTLTVTPTGADDVGTTSVGTPLATGTNLLANDRGDLSAALEDDAAHGTATVAADGSWTYTPVAGWSGTDTFTYTATDGAGQRVTPTVTVTVTPTGADDETTTTVGVPVTLDGPGVLANDVGTLHIASVTQPAAGTGEVELVGTDGGFTYTPPAGWSGRTTFTYTASDGTSTVTRTVTVTVTPTAEPDSGSTGVGQTLTVDAAHGVLANDAGALTVTTSTQPVAGSVSVAPDGSYVYTPPAEWSGATTLTYTASDGVTSLTRTLRVVVVPTADDDHGAVATGGTLDVPAVSGLLAGDRGALAVTGTSTPGHGTVTARPDGSWTYVPTPGWSGTDTFTYTASDGTTTLTRTVTVTVVPLAADDAASLPAGGPTTVPAGRGVLANDGGDLTVVGHTQPGEGRVDVRPDGGYTYTPPAGWSGTTTFTYTARDGAGQEVTRTVTLTVLPAAQDDAYRTGSSTTLTVDAGRGLLVNDTGALTVVGHSQPAHGTVDVRADGSFTLTPTPGWHGTDTFTYTVDDGTNPPLTRTVTVTVDPPVAPPAGHDDTVTARPGTPVVLHPLENDPPGDGLAWVPDTLVLVHPELGTTGTVVVVDGVGRWEVLGDGSVRFTPADGFTGRATIGYRVTNTAGETVEGTMEVRYDALAATGAQTGGLLALAVLLLVGGGVLVRVRRRDTRGA